MAQITVRLVKRPPRRVVWIKPLYELEERGEWVSLGEHVLLKEGDSYSFDVPEGHRVIISYDWQTMVSYNRRRRPILGYALRGFAKEGASPVYHRWLIGGELSFENIKEAELEEW